VAIESVTIPFVHAKEAEATVLPISTFLSESVHINMANATNFDT